MPESRKNRNWIWFFVTLAVLGALAIVINLMYNRSQQLTPEQLHAAMDLWEKHRLRDYDLTIVKKISSAASSGEPVRDELRVTVRAGKVTGATLNSQPLEERLFREYDMSGWLDYVDRFLEIDRKPENPRTFAKAIFDPETGALRHYIRRVGGTHERQELAIDLSKP